MYGYSKVYALTSDEAYLEVAEGNAQFWLSHLPEDKVPFWDFDADLSQPPPQGAQKESSAGAIAASGLLDLAKQTPSPERAETYLLAPSETASFRRPSSTIESRHPINW